MSSRRVLLHVLTAIRDNTRLGYKTGKKRGQGYSGPAWPFKPFFAGYTLSITPDLAARGNMHIGKSNSKMKKK
jgi:hypothetical protein